MRNRQKNYTARTLRVYQRDFLKDMKSLTATGVRLPLVNNC